MGDRAFLDRVARHFGDRFVELRIETVPERETARTVGCRTVIVGAGKDHSSRNIIAAIRGEG